ncbi:Tryptophan-Threonine-rich plasmodium antigen C terminal, putative [Plasmodium ovale]|uniref:Tryptophan-Threonine-rich plasmodium antigen C terminal, putative n=2 Tax=Plasmodium ovale TaxID=36330 RepID=A0A1C3KGL6_PLAOA|nr:Tryptophan-Threonine-rich plasmodium antigen C terminal, putative [Plasmodium ovale]
MLSSAPFTLFTLFSTLILSSVPSVRYKSLINSIQQNNDTLKPCPMKAIQLEEEWIDKTDEWKENEWNNWKLELEKNWKFFHLSLQNEKNMWVKNKTNEWIDWMQRMNNKWTHYNENLNETYKSNILEKSLTWDEEDWKYWANTEMKTLIVKDWENWINQCEVNMNKWIENKWIHWRSYQIMTWLNSEWKHAENIHWLKKERLEWTKPSNVKNTGDWLKWKERMYRQSDEWLTWVQNKEKLILNNKCIYWEKWKNNKNTLFDKWTKEFLNKWISEKKWNALTNERQM